MGMTWLWLAVAVTLLPLGSRGALRLAVLAGPGVPQPHADRPDWRRTVAFAPAAAIALGGAIALRVGPALGLAAWLGLSTVGALAGQAARRREEDRRLAAAAVVVQVVHAELCAGADTVAAVSASADGLFADDLHRMSQALAHARDPTSGVAAELHPLGHALRVCQSSGAPASTVLETVSAQLQDAADRRAAVAAALAGARSSAVLLAVLPAVGIALGAGLGVNPLQVLFGTAAGHALVLVGASLECAGLRWTSRMAAAAQGAPT